MEPTYNGYTESDERVKARLARAWQRHLEIIEERERIALVEARIAQVEMDLQAIASDLTKGADLSDIVNRLHIVRNYLRGM